MKRALASVCGMVLCLAALTSCAKLTASLDTVTATSTVSSTTSTTTTATTTTTTTATTTTTTTKKTTVATKGTAGEGEFVECRLDVPLFDQTAYKHVEYGRYGSVSSHGCGVVCVSMIATYKKGDGYTPDVIAEMFGNYNTAEGTLWALFPDSSKRLDLGFREMTRSEEKVLKALQNGQLVISAQKDSVFSEGGHFILLTGISAEGKIFVNDPYGPNYRQGGKLKDGFKNGFEQEDVFGKGYFWIYE